MSSGARKTKVSVTIASDLLEQIDRYGKRSGIVNRSGVIERWLRRAARLEAYQELEDDTIAYYESLSPAELAEDDEWARVSSDAFGDLAVD
jgi:metal-responsive CopG/Arc/MetJ family transcriptional regulator